MCWQEDKLVEGKLSDVPGSSPNVEEEKRNWSELKTAQSNYEQAMEKEFPGCIERSRIVLGLRFWSVKDMPLGLRYGWCGAEEDEFWCTPSDEVILFYSPTGCANNPDGPDNLSENIWNDNFKHPNSDPESKVKGSGNYRDWTVPSWDDPKGPTEPSSTPFPDGDPLGDIEEYK